jgi:hypothetical protein
MKNNTNVFSTSPYEMYSDNHKPNLSDMVFPAPEKVPNELMRDAYHKIYYSFKELREDREDIMNTLREETLKNEEQRNYIEILKQTLESNLVKSGLQPFLDKHRNMNNTGNKFYKSTSDFVVDIVQLKQDAENYRKELLNSQYNIEDLNRQIEILQTTNNEMNMKKEKIKESLENGIRELEEAKEKVQTLELEKDYLAEELNELREYNDRILKDYENTLDRNSIIEKELEILRNQISDQRLLENKLVEYKSNFEKMSEELENLFNEKETAEEKCNKFSEENQELLDNYNHIKEENENLKNLIKEKEEKISELEECNEKLLKKNEELSSNLNDSLKILSETERSLENNTSEFEKLKKDYSNLKLSNEETLIKNESLQTENENLQAELNKQKNENLQVLLENDKYRLEATEFSNNFNKILDQYETLNKNFKNLETGYNTLKMEKENLYKELSLDKEKHSNDEYSKTKEINKLSNQISSLKSEKTEMENFLNKEITKLKEEYNRSLISRNESDLLMKKELNSMKINYEELLNDKNYLEIELIEKEKYVKSLEEELSRRAKKKSNNSLEIDDGLHEVKLAIHSCLSVANVFMKKYSNCYNKELNESYYNMSSNNSNNPKFVLESLRNLEEWLNNICKELESYYLKINTFQNSEEVSSLQLQYQQIKEIYKDLCLTHEKALKELQSFKNDNKKLYDLNKKFSEENFKAGFIAKENKFFENLFSKILKSNGTPREIANLYNEIINNNNLMLNFESDRSKLQKKIDSIEREILRKKSNVNSDNPLAIELEKLNNLKNNFEMKILEKKNIIFDLEDKIKLLEEKNQGHKDSTGLQLNVFKANLIDKEKNNTNKNSNAREFRYENSPVPLNSESNSKKFFESFGHNQTKNSTQENQKEKESPNFNIPMNGPSSSYYKRVLDLNIPNSFQEK